jgi:hypothetical protein
VSCPACDLVIGAVEGGRFVHDPVCTRPLVIGAGLLRCCQCGGRLDGIALPSAGSVELEEDELDEAEYDAPAWIEVPVAPLLRFVPTSTHEPDARQRL